MSQEDKKTREGIDLSNVFPHSSQESFSSPPNSAGADTSVLIQWTLRYSGGAVKTKEQARYILLGIAVVFLFITIIIFGSMLSGTSEPPPEYRGNIPDSPEYRNPPTPQDISVR